MADDQHEQPADPTDALEYLGRLALRELSMDSLLQTVADLTKTVMPGNPETSVSLLVKGRPTTVVSTGRLASDLDETQYDEGHGPCLHAARTGEMTEIADTRTEDRWPDYTPRAVQRGNLSSLSVPLAVDPEEQVTAALNIYARRPHAFDEASRSVATRFGPYASVAVANMYAYRSARDLAQNLQTALQSRAIIDQAKGILMERYQLPADRAFQLLTRTSMTTNRKLRDVADQLVRTGELPSGSPRPAWPSAGPHAVSRRPLSARPGGATPRQPLPLPGRE